MQTALSSKRSWIARIAVLAMVASLMAIAAPAGAAIDTSASCPDAIPSAGFTDLAGVPAAAVDAIDCIAFYEISQGTTATTFDPFADVERWQMALFLTRQVEAHGLTLPASTDQGFTDLAGVPAAAVTSINQLADLGVAAGTSATTFDPFADVERWQMALFLIRLIDIAIDDNSAIDDDANNLPAATDQGFTDLAGVPDAAVTAINQLAILEVSDGTSATTYDPFMAVERWQMALFLARTLAADGITPTGLEAITVTPGDSDIVELGSGGTAVRQYTASVTEAASVTIELWSGADVNADGLLVSPATSVTTTDAEITVVNGVASTGVKATSVAPDSNGNVTFTVTYKGQLPDGVFPAVYTGTSVAGVAGATSTAPKAPTNDAFATGGLSTVLDPAASNATITVVVTAVDKDMNYFLSSTNAYFYDDNDTFRIGGVPVTAANFETNLSTGDTVTGVYTSDASLSSSFDNNDAAPAAPTLTLGTVSSNEVDLSWTAVTGATYTVKRSTTAATGPFSPIATGLTTTTYEDKTAAASTTYYYVVSATIDGDESTNSNAVTANTPAATETVQPTLTDLRITDGGTTLAFVDSGDTIRFQFSEEMAATLAGAPNTTEFFRVNDGDSTYQLAGGTWTLANYMSGSTTITNGQLTVTGFTLTFVSGIDNDLDLLNTNTLVAVSSGFDDVNNNQLDLAGSADTVLDIE